MALPPDCSLLEINDSTFQDGARSLQEVTRIALSLETNDVISSESVINRLSNVAGQKLPAANIRPWDVYKLLHNNAWMALANHRGSQVKMVIMQHNNRCCILANYFNIYSICNCAVGYIIAIFPGILQLIC